VIAASLQLIHNRDRRTSAARVDVLLGECLPCPVVDKCTWSAGPFGVSGRHLRFPIIPTSA
jgi:hypothetical protein